MLGIACVLTLIGLWAYVHAQTPTPSSVVKLSSYAETPGRYRVSQVDLDYPAWGESNLKEKTAMKVDTQTGQTWLLTEYKDASGAPHLEWVEKSDIAK